MSAQKKKPLSDTSVFDSDWAFDTLAVRAGQERSQFGEHAEVIYLTSGYKFDSAAQAAARFAEQEPGNIYSRFTNPSVSVFQTRLAALEGAERCVATSSGMSAILALCMAHLSAGDHLLAANGLFGSTLQLLHNILSRFGVTTTCIPASDTDAWSNAVQPNTKLFFLETPANPLTEIADIAAIADIARQSGALLAVDNTFCTPVLQKPLALGADLVMHSATKFIDGQGRTLGGAVCGSEALTQEIYRFLRTAGPTLSAFNAWVLLKGLETLSLRVKTQSAIALELAAWLETQPKVERVYHPDLPSHPQHALAQKQQQGGGAIVSFEVAGGQAAAWQVVDACRLFSITANLGDTKSTITHPATTTHGRISAEQRAAAGIGDNLLRLAAGLEAMDDLKNDLQRGLDTL